MKKFLRLTPLALVALMVSCNDVETDTKSTQGFTNCYAIVTDTHTGTVSVTQPLTIGLALNWTQSTAEMAVTGLTINGSTYPQLSLLDISWGPTQDKLWAKSSTSAPSAVTSTNQRVDVTDFNMQWSDRLDIPGLPLYTYDPALSYSFELEKRYMIVGSRSPFNFWGTTTAASEGVDPFTSGVNQITATPNFEKMTMTVLVNGAQFASQMPALNIQLDNIPLEFVDGGKKFEFKAETIVPTIANVPYENYICSNVHGTLDPEKGMTFSFDCNVMGRKIYNVSTAPTVFGYRE